MFEDIEILHFIIKGAWFCYFLNFCLKLRVKTSVKATQIKALTLCRWSSHCPGRDHLGCPPTPDPTATFRADPGLSRRFFACCGQLFAQPPLPLDPRCCCPSGLLLELFGDPCAGEGAAVLSFCAPTSHPLQSCSTPAAPGQR